MLANQLLKVTFYPLSDRHFNLLLEMSSTHLKDVLRLIHQKLFEEMAFPGCNLRVFWTDDVGDDIEIISQKDFEIFTMQNDRPHLKVSSENLQNDFTKNNSYFGINDKQQAHTLLSSKQNLDSRAANEITSSNGHKTVMFFVRLKDGEASILQNKDVAAVPIMQAPNMLELIQSNGHYHFPQQMQTAIKKVPNMPSLLKIDDSLNEQGQKYIQTTTQYVCYTNNNDKTAVAAAEDDSNKHVVTIANDDDCTKNETLAVQQRISNDDTTKSEIKATPTTTRSNNSDFVGVENMLHHENIKQQQSKIAANGLQTQANVLQTTVARNADVSLGALVEVQLPEMPTNSDSNSQTKNKKNKKQTIHFTQDKPNSTWKKTVATTKASMPTVEAATFTNSNNMKRNSKMMNMRNKKGKNDAATRKIVDTAEAAAAAAYAAAKSLYDIY